MLRKYGLCRVTELEPILRMRFLSNTFTYISSLSTFSSILQNKDFSAVTIFFVAKNVNAEL